LGTAAEGNKSFLTRDRAVIKSEARDVLYASGKILALGANVEG
jgi:hypothetical protein